MISTRSFAKITPNGSKRCRNEFSVLFFRKHARAGEAIQRRQINNSDRALNQAAESGLSISCVGSRSGAGDQTVKSERAMPKRAGCQGPDGKEMWGLMFVISLHACGSMTTPRRW